MATAKKATTKAPKEPKPQITLLEAMQALTDSHGSQAEAARQTGINKTYWTRLLSGVKDWPSDATLEALGLKRNVSYEWIKKAPKPAKA